MEIVSKITMDVETDSQTSVSEVRETELSATHKGNAQGEGTFDASTSQSATANTPSTGSISVDCAKRAVAGLLA